MMDLRQILEILPHRYPFLLVDKVLEIRENGITAIKNVTFNEPHFMGHFPGYPVMPGVLIVEALAQAAGIYALSKQGESGKGKFFLFMSIENAKFRRIVEPGDTLTLNCEVLRAKRDLLKSECVASVNGEVACEAVLTAVMREVK
ncbi:3-hydroxyacyl-ACP dehydratase FabZ [Geovibrio thiophilus]|uniref:3-hydroxyacyl-[acyl-carrier-protein] dehydratase FabZ n=1 Tax=Geovibrio thiophilus TaxID=139438 RepID=A0A3R6AZC6_9BACT|nr:3-hydroxyacyl-ACP dehydratase FabZ [Geovibrio thiophilus]QAR34032.1 3-hydroxyacyl-ACP dehydratase FabZ [Geovibrio thiophilus]